MSAIFRPSNVPTRINQVRINQSVLGYALPVIMGRGKLQQSVLWVDGFKANSISGQTNGSGGKGFGGGGKDGAEYDYTADVIAALCNGNNGLVLGIGDAWSGQSWLSNSAAAETYDIPSGGGMFTPSNSAITADAGVSAPATVNYTANDLLAPGPVTLTDTTTVPFQRVPYAPGTPLTTGQYSVDGSNNYYFAAADAGRTVTIEYSYSLATIKKQQVDLIPAGLQIQVGSNQTGETATPFKADGGVIYYSTDGSNPKTGQALIKVSGTPTQAGTYSVSGTEPATYQFASADANQEVLITYELDNSKALLVGTPQSLRFMLFEGTKGQGVWSLLSTAYPGAALGYTGIAFVAYDPMDLGVGGDLQQNTFEIFTADAWGGGIVDCNPIQCILQVLANSVWGLGTGPSPFPVSAIDNGPDGTWGTPTNSGLPSASQGSIFHPIFPGGSVLQDATASSWFAAHSFFISPVIDQQDTAASLISKWLEAGACPGFMSEGLLKFVPYGDTSATGNGVTWTAPKEYAAELDDTDFMAKSNADPVSISSSAWQDAFNHVQISWSNRTAQYGPDVTPESDQAAINRYGERIEDPQAFDFITTLPAATFAAFMRVKRNVYTRNTYQFKLSFRYSYLEPMDVVSITTSSAWAGAELNQNLGIANYPVRITKIVDNPDGTLDVTAEDYAYGLHAPVKFGKDIGRPIPLANTMADPGDTEAVFFEATDRLSGFKGNQLWIGAMGSDDNWGGANVLASMDGDTYKKIGTITAPARIGTLAADIGDTDPDTENIVIDLNENAAALEAGTQADADQDNTLCYLDGELISYSAASVTGQDQYTLGTYTRRGRMGSTAAAHSAGGAFMRLDSAVLKFTYDPSWAGKTVYLKFQGFNSWGNSPRDASTITAQQFTIPGKNPGAFDASTGAILGTVSATSTALIQPLVDAGALSPGTYGDTSYTKNPNPPILYPISENNPS